MRKFVSSRLVGLLFLCFLYFLVYLFAPSPIGIVKDLSLIDVIWWEQGAWVSKEEVKDGIRSYARRDNLNSGGNLYKSLKSHKEVMEFGFDASNIAPGFSMVKVHYDLKDKVRVMLYFYTSEKRIIPESLGFDGLVASLFMPYLKEVVLMKAEVYKDGILMDASGMDNSSMPGLSPSERIKIDLVKNLFSKDASKIYFAPRLAEAINHASK
jgi:hypothetical protein